MNVTKDDPEDENIVRSGSVTDPVVARFFFLENPKENIDFNKR